MLSTQKKLDSVVHCGLPFAQVASNPRVNERNRTELRYLCAQQIERLSGRGVIEYLFAGNIPAVLVDGLSYPAALKADHLKNNEEHQNASIIPGVSRRNAPTHPNFQAKPQNTPPQKNNNHARRRTYIKTTLFKIANRRDKTHYSVRNVSTCHVSAYNGGSLSKRDIETFAQAPHEHKSSII